MDRVSLIIWILAYSLCGANLILGIICFFQSRRREILIFILWHILFYFISVCSILLGIYVIGADTFRLLLFNALLLSYLIIPAMLYALHLRKFPFILYLLLYVAGSLIFNLSVILKLPIFPYFYCIWWIPPILSLTLFMGLSEKLEGDNEKSQKFFRSIIKVSYLSLGIPIIMNLIAFGLSFVPSNDRNSALSIAYGIFYSLISIPGLLYFLDYHFRKKKEQQAVTGQAVLQLLSNREQEIVKLLMEGKKYREIGDELFISMSTVKKHTNNIYRKTGTSSARLLIQKILQEH